MFIRKKMHETQEEKYLGEQIHSSAKHAKLFRKEEQKDMAL